MNTLKAGLHPQTCIFCSTATRAIEPSYTECTECDVLLSLIPAAAYDEDYYYFRLNARSREAREPPKCCGRISLAISIPMLALISDVMMAPSWGGDAERRHVRRGGRQRARSGHRQNSKLWVLLVAAGPRGRKFKCITTFDVIEHFDIVDDFLKYVSGYLEDNGLQIMTIPKQEQQMAQDLQRRLAWVRHPAVPQIYNV